MKKEIRTEIEIDASAERVWSVLADFPRFPEWNPFVTRVEGEPKEGARLKIDVQLPGSRMLKFTPIVLKADAGRELRWVGNLPFGAFRGEHFYIIERISDAKCRFVHGEHFSGWMVRLIWLMVGKQTEAGYHLMNDAIKAEAERR
ncbi:MAG: SRPBCC domain-containing protein [Acidobacteria bacterium]|nr:SRPBCC domain-containing protein [Acidobacteriota bacterium]